MSRVIINNKSSLSDMAAIGLVMHVISGGRISNNDAQYCYATKFKVEDKSFLVLSAINKGSDSFSVINCHG